MTITNGTARYMRRVNTGDYQHKECEVSLTFDSGADAADAATQAQAIVLARLGIDAPAAADPTPAAAPATRKPRAPKVETSAASSSPASPKTDPMAMGDTSTGAPTSAGTTSTATSASPAADPMSMVDELTAGPADEAPRPITDAVMQAEVGNAKVRIGDPAAIAIKKLLGKFVAPGQGVSFIVQEQRPAFMAAIKALV